MKAILARPVDVEVVARVAVAESIGFLKYLENKATSGDQKNKIILSISDIVEQEKFFFLFLFMIIIIIIFVLLLL
jgi:hypothetical protein